MASTRTYKLRGIVLRKTKLADKDLIVTLLADDGELCKAVAKGARKPGGSLAARLELFSTCDLMLAKGRTLDVVTEAKLVAGESCAAFGLEQAACAAVVSELVNQVAQPGLEQPRLFDMTRAALAAIAATTPETALIITAGDLMKTMALVGYRPSFSTCIACGNRIMYDDAYARVPVSVLDGGAFCPNCPRPSDSVLVDSRIVRWNDALIASTFAEIAKYEIDVATSFELLQFARQWIRAHTGRDLKSFDFLFTSGLY